MKIEVATKDHGTVVYEGVGFVEPGRNWDELCLFGPSSGAACADGKKLGHHPEGAWAYWRVVPERGAEGHVEGGGSWNSILDGAIRSIEVLDPVDTIRNRHLRGLRRLHGHLATTLNFMRSWAASKARLLRVVEAAQNAYHTGHRNELGDALAALTPEDREAP